MKRLIILAAVAALALPAAAQNTAVYTEQGGAKLVVASGGELEIQSGGTLDLQEGLTFTFAESQTFTLGADEYVKIDADTTAQTQTAGSLDINFGSITANANAFNLLCKANNGTTAAADIFCSRILVQANDADADMFGVEIILDATSVAAAGSYAYGVAVDCKEDTAGACLDGVLVTSSGTDTGLTDGIDVSASNIANAVNIGANPILGVDDTLSIGATDDVVTLDSNDSAGTYNCTDADANANCAFAAGGTGIATLGASTNVSAAVVTDGTGDAELALPENSVGPDELAVMVDQILLCGELAENDTTYLGPGLTGAILGGSTTYTIGSADCDGLDNVTEATADAPITNLGAVKVLGMWCVTDGTLGAGEAVTYTARSAAADLTPSVTCTIGAGASYCRTLTASTTDVAAGATLAVQAVEESNNSDDNGWCRLYVGLK